MDNKKGQITIFVIIAIVIIAVVALYFVFRSDIPTSIPGFTARTRDNPNALLKTCLEDKIEKGVELIGTHGGYIENPFNRTFKFIEESQSYDLSFLCYTREYYVPCVNQQPGLLNHLENELSAYVSDDVKDCFDELASDLEGKGYDVSADYKGFEINLIKGKIELFIDGKISLSSEDESSVEENLFVSFNNKIYDLGVVAQQVVFQEAKYCSFNYVGYMILYPQFDIDYFKTSDDVGIYTIKDRKTEDWFRFAVRSCVIPQGL